jgi:hypothetical protein
VQAVIVTADREATVERLRTAHDQPLSTAELLEVPTLLVGTEDEVVAQLRAHRERFGFSYVSVLEPSMAALAPVVARRAGT